jgi:leucyl/phenylalanyl-tRNA---protein transferase
VLDSASRVPVYLLNEELRFPPPELAEEEGVLAVGGDLRPERLVLAYSQGIFPWPMRDFPLLWFSPDPRFVLFLEEAHFSKSLRKSLKSGRYTVRADTNFEEVIAACADVPRPGQDGTWITPELERAYLEMHRLGFAHSIETYEGDELVGGLYGISLGHGFFGESMFAKAPDASKVAFATLILQLRRWGFPWIDCQVETQHLARFGARHVPRGEFLVRLREAVAEPTRRGPWVFDELRDD